MLEDAATLLILQLLERPTPTPLPQAQCLIPLFAFERGNGIDHHAEQHGAIIVGEFGQSGLRDQAAQLVG
jgi:hypothetical protein